MQTFLPYDSFQESARVLDRQRLGKQRVEAKQILMTLRGQRTGWRSHPAVRMWSGHYGALAEYGIAVCREWRSRGYDDTLLPWFKSQPVGGGLPKWLGNPIFHASHRSNLLRKLPEHYRQFWPDEQDDIPYVWPAGNAVDELTDP